MSSTDITAFTRLSRCTVLQNNNYLLMPVFRKWIWQTWFVISFSESFWKLPLSMNNSLVPSVVRTSNLVTFFFLSPSQHPPGWGFWRHKGTCQGIQYHLFPYFIFSWKGLEGNMASICPAWPLSSSLGPQCTMALEMFLPAGWPNAKGATVRSRWLSPSKGTRPAEAFWALLRLLLFPSPSHNPNRPLSGICSWGLVSL